MLEQCWLIRRYVNGFRMMITHINVFAFGFGMTSAVYWLFASLCGPSVPAVSSLSKCFFHFTQFYHLPECLRTFCVRCVVLVFSSVYILFWRCYWYVGTNETPKLLVFGMLSGILIRYLRWLAIVFVRGMGGAWTNQIASDEDIWGLAVGRIPHQIVHVM